MMPAAEMSTSDIWVCEERLAAQEERVRELQALAERVSRETGGEALRADAAALGARLEAVRRSARALADVGEARAQRRGEAVREAIRAREMLGSVQKSLATVEENEGEKVEEQLITLREHLLSLGKSEGRILNAKDTSVELGPAAAAETSIVEILELWQHMFRDTFHQYHRLSSSLVKTRDAETALRLWREYLLNVQSFLSGSIPDDYHNLTEHQRLCEVHQNLLATQKSSLLSNGDRLSADDTEEHVAEKFNMLTNFHNETLSHVIDRHAQVSARIAAWECYRTDQALMLQWLRDVEREKEKLHLRYIHIRRVTKVLARIELLLEKVPTGTAQADNLLAQQKRILQFCDEGFSASIRMELAGIVKRIENIQAGLETWRDYLIKIINLIAKYDDLTNKLQKTYNDIQNDISNMNDTTKRTEPKRLIEQLTKYKIEVGKSTSDLDELSVVQEQLKECLSPQDVKSINQRLWLLRQQQADLDHQVSVLMHQVQEKLELDIIFDSRRTRLINWMTDLEIRLDKGNQLGSMGAINPQELVRKIETELQSEMALKEREYEWVMAAGKELYDEAGDSDDRKQYKADLLKKVEEVRDRWSRLKEIGKSRINKINDLLLTIFQLEERLVEIRLWICHTESQLVAPIVLERPTHDQVERKLVEHDAIQKSIESESGEIAEVLNLCELLLNDVDTWRGNFDTQNLKTNMDFVDKKWRTICEMSAVRKNNLYEMLKLLQVLMEAGHEDEQWVLDIDSRLFSIEDILDEISQAEKAEAGARAQKLQEEIESRDEALKSLEEKYSKLAKSGLEVENLQRLLAPVRETLNRWRGLEVRVTRVLGALRQETSAHRRFIDAHGQAVVGLTQVDVRLTRLQHLSRHPDDLLRQLAELQGVQDELESYGELLQNTDELGLALMQNARSEEVASIQEMIDEYQLLWKDISVRIERMRRARRPDRDEQVQVETLKFERDSATQVDTLSSLSRVTSMTSRDAYTHELHAAIGECGRNLSALEGALAGGEPTRDSPELREATAALSKRAALAQSNVELVAHLSELLLTEFECGEEESRLKEVEALKLRYSDLLARSKKREVHVRNLQSSRLDLYVLNCAHEAGRLTCPLCSQRNWKQLDNDLWRLEQWLQAAEARQDTRRAPPSRIDELEDAIQDHREFLLDLDGHRAIVVSLNVVGDHLAEHAGSATRARELRARLAGDNSRWDAACAAAGAWQARLQAALLSNAEFHHTLEELSAWLTRAERQTRAAEPLQLLAPAHVLAARFHHFTELRGELERAEPRVLALQEAADQLLRVDDAPEGAHEICKKLSELRLRLHALRRLAAVYALRLGAALARARPGADLAASLAAAAAVQLVDRAETLEAPPAPPSTDEQTDDDVDTGVLVRSMRFLTRVARAALPFQALLLLLLGAAALLPGARDSDACARTPPGLEPVLRYPHGPPPM